LEIANDAVEESRFLLYHHTSIVPPPVKEGQLVEDRGSEAAHLPADVMDNINRLVFESVGSLKSTLPSDKDVQVSKISANISSVVAHIIGKTIFNTLNEMTKWKNQSERYMEMIALRDARISELEREIESLRTRSRASPSTKAYRRSPSFSTTRKRVLDDRIKAVMLSNKTPKVIRTGMFNGSRQPRSAPVSASSPPRKRSFLNTTPSTTLSEKRTTISSSRKVISTIHRKSNDKVKATKSVWK
jgi:hypothetical protein